MWTELKHIDERILCFIEITHSSVEWRCLLMKQSFLELKKPIPEALLQQMILLNLTDRFIQKIDTHEVRIKVNVTRFFLCYCSCLNSGDLYFMCLES